MFNPPIPDIVDIVIIGGGINGCGCAADAALRGLSVVLCEKDDLASKTSSASSKLIHGGLRYLEQFDFSLVKSALDERQLLLDLAPHLVHPLRFIAPSNALTRPRWILRAGLFLYDHLSKKNRLPQHEPISRTHQAHYFSSLQTNYQQGFSYYDAQTDDSRLVITNALQAKAHGATILTKTELTQAYCDNGLWKLTLRSANGDTIQLKAKVLINASGAHVQHINQITKVPARYQTTLVQGSHIIVPKWYDGSHAYLLQNPDKRIVFVMPYYEHLLIGTTETLFNGDPNKVTALDSEIDYLKNTIQRFFNHAITHNDVLHHTAGVRTLITQNKSKLLRNTQSNCPKTLSAEPHCSLAHEDSSNESTKRFDHALELSKKLNMRTMSRDWVYDFVENPAPCVIIYSGKLTTYRKLAEKIIDQCSHLFHHIKPGCTHTTPLVGSLYHDMNFQQYRAYIESHFAWLDNKTRTRYLNTYGTLTEKFLSKAKGYQDLGIDFGHTLYQAEVDYLIHEEWACCTDDILWRRTQLGLFFTPQQIETLGHYLSSGSSSNIPLTSTSSA